MTYATRYNLDNVDNALVATKNAIIERIDEDIVSADDLHAVLHHLYDVVKLWGSLSYNYKGDELAERVEYKATTLAKASKSVKKKLDLRMVRNRARIVAEMHRDEKYRLQSV